MQDPRSLVVPFLSNSREGQCLSNLAPYPLVWNRVNFQHGSEEAYVYARIHLGVPSTAENPSKQEYLDRLRQCQSPVACKHLGSEVKQRFNMEKFDRISWLVMLSILLAKVRQHAVVRAYLLSTGKKMLVEANPRDSKWGIGMSENEVLGQVAMCIRNGVRWRPPADRNMVGRLWMEVRSHTTGEAPLPTSLVIGDSELRDVSVNDAYKVFWPGANIEKLFDILDFVKLPGLRLIIFHGGTNDIAAHWPEGDVTPNPHDGSIRTVGVPTIMRRFEGRYAPFDRETHVGRSLECPLYFSEILFRHCNPPDPAIKKTFAPASMSEAQATGGRVNDNIRAMSQKPEYPRLFFIDSSPFRNPGYFHRYPDGRYDLHINEKGAHILSVIYQNVIDHCAAAAPTHFVVDHTYIDAWGAYLLPEQPE